MNDTTKAELLRLAKYFEDLSASGISEAEVSNVICHRCSIQPAPGEVERYDVSDGGVSYTFNVTAAIAYVSQHRTASILAEGDILAQMILGNLSESFCGAHVDHVDENIPAIIGNFEGRVFIMDGTHRIVKRLKKTLPPIAYVLSNDETHRFLILMTREE